MNVFELIREKIENITIDNKQRMLFKYEITEIIDEVAQEYEEKYITVPKDDFTEHLINMGYNKALKDASNNGWIPCIERLPDEATTYEVTEEIFINSKKQYIVEQRLFGTEGKWLCPSNRKIIAWQPLLAPYKEGHTDEYIKGYNQGTVDRADEIEKAREYGYNKAIDEFADKLKDSLLHNYRHLLTIDKYGFEWLTTNAVETHIDEIAEQLKGGSADDE